MVSFGGNSFNVTGNISGTENLLIQATKNSAPTSGTISSSGAISGGNVTLATNGALTLSKGSTTNVSKSLYTKSSSLYNEGHIEGKYADMDFINNSTFNAGQIIGNSINIKTTSDMFNEGMLYAYGDLNIDTQNKGRLVNKSSIYADTLTISATKVVNGGYRCGFMSLKTCDEGNLNANKLVLNSGHNYANEMGGVQRIKLIEVNTLK